VIVSHVSNISVPAGEVKLAHVCRVCGQETSCIKHKDGFSCLTCRAFLRSVTLTRTSSGGSTVSPHLDLELLPDIKLSHDNFLFQVTETFHSVLGEASLFSSGLSARDLLAPPSQFSPATRLSAGLEWLAQLVLKFLSQNSFFQSLSPETQASQLRRNLPQISIVILAMFFSPERQSFRWDFSPGDLERLREVRQRLRSSLEINKYQVSRHLGNTVTAFIVEAVTKLAQLPRFGLVLLVLVSVFTTDEAELARVDQQRRGYLNILQRSVREQKHLEQLSAHLPGMLEKLGQGCRYLRAEKAPTSRTPAAR